MKNYIKFNKNINKNIQSKQFIQILTKHFNPGLCNTSTTDNINSTNNETNTNITLQTNTNNINTDTNSNLSNNEEKMDKNNKNDLKESLLSDINNKYLNFEKSSIYDLLDDIILNINNNNNLNYPFYNFLGSQIGSYSINITNKTTICNTFSNGKKIYNSQNQSLNIFPIININSKIRMEFDFNKKRVNIYHNNLPCGVCFDNNQISNQILPNIIIPAISTAMVCTFDLSYIITYIILYFCFFYIERSKKSK